MKKDTHRKEFKLHFKFLIGKTYPQVVPLGMPLGMSHFHFIGPVEFKKKLRNI